MEIKFPLGQISTQTNQADKWTSKCIQISNDSMQVDDFIA